MNKENGNIILIGFMGSGKTTFGKWISEKHGMKFIDTDEYIENKQGRLIKDIFRESGEEVFRDMETAAVRELIDNTTNTVISVGGGLPLREVNRKLLRQLGCVVFLDTSVDELVRRLDKDTSRPLLAGGDVRQKIESLMQARMEYYKEAADLIVTTTNNNFTDIYNTIVSAINMNLTGED